jgi:hypothetical protein
MVCPLQAELQVASIAAIAIVICGSAKTVTELVPVQPAASVTKTE